eukprot:CFRG7361T1
MIVTSSMKWVAAIATVLQFAQAVNVDDVVYAVNCGGPTHIGKNGIVYSADTTKGGNSHTVTEHIIGCSNEDMALYQSEHWDDDSFMYTADNINRPGEYTAVFKFSEVYFNEAGKKVFGLYINDVEVTDHIDIFAEVGAFAAYDLIVPFKIRDDLRVQLNEGEASIATEKKSKLEIELRIINGLDNPKINAFFIAYGNPTDLEIYPIKYGEQNVDDDDQEDGDVNYEEEDIYYEEEEEYEEGEL